VESVSLTRDVSVPGSAFGNVEASVRRSVCMHRGNSPIADLAGTDPRSNVVSPTGQFSGEQLAGRDDAGETAAVWFTAVIGLTPSAVSTSLCGPARSNVKVAPVER
jgi:hypothetical protein